MTHYSAQWQCQQLNISPRENGGLAWDEGSSELSFWTRETPGTGEFCASLGWIWACCICSKNKWLNVIKPSLWNSGDKRKEGINLTCPTGGRCGALWATSVVGWVMMSQKQGTGSTGPLPYRPHYNVSTRALSRFLLTGGHRTRMRA